MNNMTRWALVLLVLVAGAAAVEARPRGTLPSSPMYRGSGRENSSHVLVNKRNGSSYWRTAADSTLNNNFSTRGNRNVYTGQWGTRASDRRSRRR